MSYKIAKVWGIPIKLHISLIVILLLAIMNMPFLYGILLFTGLMVSLTLHELGHSIVAKLYHCHVREITLMFMGGVAQMDRVPSKPLSEFLMAIAGPFVSLALVFILFYVGSFDFWPRIQPSSLNLAQHLGWINIVLFGFNLMPAFPMDGGRVLRAILTAAVGKVNATRVAAGIGKFFALVMFSAAVLAPLFDPKAILFGTANRVILGVIAVFIYVSAKNELRMVLTEEALRIFMSGQWAQPQPPDDLVDKVLISPPPYEKGPASESPVSHGEDDPSKHFPRK